MWLQKNPEKPITAWTWEDVSALSVFLHVRLLYCKVPKYTGMPCNITWGTTLKTRQAHNLIPTKSVLKNMPKVSQKTPKALQRTTQMDQKSYFSVSGAPTGPYAARTSQKWLQNDAPGRPKETPLGSENDAGEQKGHPKRRKILALRGDWKI